MKSKKIVWVCLLSLVGACVLTPTSGCGQKSAQIQDQPSDQRNETSNKQDQAAQGNIYVNVLNGTGTSGGGGAGPGGSDGVSALINEAVASAGGSNSSGGQRATYAQSGFTINVTTGGVSPALTGTNTGGAATQTPTNTGTHTPTQHVQPETSASVPISVALPGGNNSTQSNAVGRGASGEQTKQDTLDQTTTTTILKAQADKIGQLEALVRALRSQPAATSKPTNTTELIPLTPVP